MNEKRFFVEEIDTNQYGVYDRLKIGYIKPLVYTDWTVGLDYTQSVCDLLNDCDDKMNEVYEKLIIGKGSSEVIDMIKFGDNLCGVAIKELFDRNKKLQEENKQLKSELNDLKDMEKSIKSERFYIHCGDDINKQLFDTESDFNIHIEEVGSDEELLIRLCNLLNEQQATINKLEQRDYYNQSERYEILGRAIELASDYIHRNDLEYYDFCGLVTEFEKELLDGE